MSASNQRADFSAITLEDKYALESTRAYMTGVEALARLPMLQHQRDKEAGLNTAGFISGYRGSPLGGVDKTLWQARHYLEQHNIHFQPGINEDLAATAVWGSQQVGLFPGAKYDGVFSMWYGKGPGVDRSMDAIKHGNAFGTSKYGGVLAVAGDDHACKSSTLPHQSEHMFIGASMPILNPANVQEVLDLGIFGWELSRFSGCWVALKAITENIDSAISAEIDPHRVQIVIPTDFDMPPQGLNAIWPVKALEQERILNKYRIYAARHFAYVNKLNKVVIDSPKPRLGIITTGKAYLDVRQALDDLGIDDAMAAALGLRVFKVGMSWPLEPISTHEFAKGLEEILVVEEKRSIIEDQLTGQLYNWPVTERPRVVGEFDEQHNDLLPNLAELTPAMIARAIAARLANFSDSQFSENKTIKDRLAFLEAKEAQLAKPRNMIERLPHFCSGCPHNTSTKVPDGSMAFAGIGCHYMASWMDRHTETYTQMGGEGTSWIGMAPFTETNHVFQNLGDGTYFHSGILAIRATIASKVNITYKILFNHAVAMTGGQAVDGQLTLDQMIEQLSSEGVKRIAVVTNEPKKYGVRFPHKDGLTLDHRDNLATIQNELRNTKGTTVLIYDQSCATEKRRILKKEQPAEKPTRVFINPAVCEGCGDCGTASNCLSVLPLDTKLGRKRSIDQNACNHDYSCLNGFCPSFVTVEGADLQNHQSSVSDSALETLFNLPIPEPTLPAIEFPWNIVVTGIGGTGILTVSSVLAMAAHLEGKGCSTLNQTGLAQKFGSVISHVRIGKTQESIHAVRVPAGDADLLLGCDLVVAASDEALAKLHNQRSHVVANDHPFVTSEFVHNPDYHHPSHDMRAVLTQEANREHVHFVEATRIAKDLLGDSIASNLFLLGFAFQKGLIPVSAEAILRAIELNAVAVAMNKQAFRLGRIAVVHPQKLSALGEPLDAEEVAETLEDIVSYRTNFLKDYQNQTYADRYREVIDRVIQWETAFIKAIEPSSNFKTPTAKSDRLPLSEGIAKSLFKLMAIKDEYEVARLYSTDEFRNQLRAQFSGDLSLRFHLAPPIFSKKDPVTGLPKKREFGEWMLSAMKLLSRIKFLRHTPLDIFQFSKERKIERELLADFETQIRKLLQETSQRNYTTAIAIANLPQQVRGFGHVKEKAINNYHNQLEKLWREYEDTPVKVVHIMERVA